MTATGTAPAPASPQSQAVRQRYKDAYRVAGAVSGAGTAIKVIGIMLGVLVALLGVVTSSPAVMFPAILVAIAVAVIFFVFGTLISAQGQVLKANLDTAVNTSPFLSNEHRAQIMSLPPGALVAAGMKDCPDCAESIRLEAVVCQYCGHKFEHAEVQVAIEHAKAVTEKAAENMSDEELRDSLATGRPEIKWELRKRGYYIP
jgi:hypothetical protein